MDVVRHILHTIHGLAPAKLNKSFDVLEQGFYISDNPAIRSVWVEALGFSEATKLMLSHYREVIGSTLRSSLGVNGDDYVEVSNIGMVRVFGLTNAQIAHLHTKHHN